MNRLAVAALLSLVALGCESSAKAGEIPDPKTLYTAELKLSSADVKAGEGGTVVLSVRPKAGAHVKGETPFKALLAATGPVTIEKTELGFKDHTSIVEEGPVFEVPFKASAAGEGKLDADLSFYVCIAEACVKTTEKLSTAVTVK